MKYIKITISLLVLSLCIGLCGVDARQYTRFVDIKIPIFGGEFVSEQVGKGDDNMYTQKVKKTYIEDNVVGGGRAIEGKVEGRFAGMSTTGWLDLPQGSNVDFGSSTIVQGGYKLHLKSTKILPTTAVGSFNWDLGTIDYSPYPVYS